MKKLILILMFMVIAGMFGTQAQLVEASGELGWHTQKSVDEMSGEREMHATSSWAVPTKPMAVPYKDTKAILGISCNRKKTRGYVRFNTPPNLSKVFHAPGWFEYDVWEVFVPRAKWDNVLKKIVLRRLTGSENPILDFVPWAVGRNLKRIKSSNSLLLEFSWLNQGPVRFQFDIAGAADAVNEIQGVCETWKLEHRRAKKQSTKTDRTKGG